MPDVFYIDFKKSEIYEAGALLLMMLAFPPIAPNSRDGKTQDADRDRMFNALCSQALQWRASLDPGWARTPQHIKPIYLISTEKDLKWAAWLLDRRLAERMDAARMAIGMLQKHQGLEVQLPEGISRVSVNELAKAVGTDKRRNVTADNVEKNIWKPSRPVLHLAVAIQLLLHRRQANGKNVAPSELVYDRKVIEEIVREAQNLEASIEAYIPAISKEKIIRFRLA